MIATTSYMESRIKPRTTLTYDDLPGARNLPAKNLNA
jgi:hypothetical protein